MKWLNGALVGPFGSAQGERGRTLAEALWTSDGERLRRYREMLDLYEGRHWLRPIRNGRSMLTVNYPRVVVDKAVSYLLGEGLHFAVPGREQGLSEPSAAAAERLLYDVYQDGDVDAQDQQTALQSIALGDGFQKVYWDPAARQISVVDVDPMGVFPAWSGDRRGEFWRIDSAYRIQADEANRLYGTAARSGSWVAVVERWTAETFELFVGNEQRQAGPNPYGWVPFVHLPNLPVPGEQWGRSELADVASLVRAYNERLSDQADTIRYHADPPTIFKGVAEHTDLAVGPGTVWDIPADASVELLEWRGTAPEVEQHLERLLRSIYEVSETPRTAFGDSGRLLSGVALETELRPLIQKTIRRRFIWTTALRKRARMILRLAELYGVGDGRLGYAPYRARVIWPRLMPRDEAQEVLNESRLVGNGLRSVRTAMDQLGTQDPEAELARVTEDAQQLQVAGLRPSPAQPPTPASAPRPGNQPAGR
jgi:hypothetical protein